MQHTVSQSCWLWRVCSDSLTLEFYKLSGFVEFQTQKLWTPHRLQSLGHSHLLLWLFLSWSANFEFHRSRLSSCQTRTSLTVLGVLTLDSWTGRLWQCRFCTNRTSIEFCRLLEYTLFCSLNFLLVFLLSADYLTIGQLLKLWTQGYNRRQTFWRLRFLPVQVRVVRQNPLHYPVDKQGCNFWNFHRVWINRELDAWNYCKYRYIRTSNLECLCSCTNLNRIVDSLLQNIVCFLVFLQELYFYRISVGSDERF